MQNIRNHKVVSLFSGILVAFALTPVSLGAEQVSNQAIYTVNSIVKPSESANLGISPVDFELRWGADEDELAVGAGGVIRPHKLLSVDETVTGSIPVSASEVSGAAKAVKTESIVKVVASSNDNIAECGPSPLSEAQIRDLVIREAQAAEIRVNFALAITKAESNFDRIRNSPKGARGPMQLMPETASDYGVEDICDPEDNIRGGVAHLRRLFDTLANPLLVAAAYNAGEGRIAEYGGIPPFEETLNYVAKVINFELGLDPPVSKTSPGSGELLTASRTDRPDRQKASGVTRPAKGEWTAGVLQF